MLSYTINAILKKSQSLTTNIDSIIFFKAEAYGYIYENIGRSGTSTTEASEYIYLNQLFSYLTDAILRATYTKIYSVDYLPKKTQIANCNLDGILKGPESSIYAVDAVLKNNFSRTHNADSLLRQTVTKTYSADCILLSAARQTAYSYIYENAGRELGNAKEGYVYIYENAGRDLVPTTEGNEYIYLNQLLAALLSYLIEVGYPSTKLFNNKPLYIQHI